MRGSYGFIHEKTDIKILILFILRRLREPVTFDTLTELTMCDEGIGYFDYSECVAELVKTGHLLREGDNYSVTPKGNRNGEITESALPYTVRMKAENAASLLRVAQSRDLMIKTFRTNRDEGGLTVNLSLSDGIGDIVAMELFAVNERQASALEKGFRANAEKVYNSLLDMLTATSE